MILCVTLNAALDVTYHVDGVRWNGTNRVASVAERAGGKGINVARVLHALGEPVLVTGLAGGDTGERIRRDLRAAGLPGTLVPVAGESRRTVAVVDQTTGDVTGLWEPGPVVAPAEWTRFVAHYTGRVPDARVVVLSGSVPPGLPEDAYPTLVTLARAIGVPVILDADAATLRTGVRAHLDLVKPNADELRAATGETDPLVGAERLRNLGAGAVAVSLGPDGLVAVTPDGRWRARPPATMTGNPTGAGDAGVAALARGLAAGSDWPTRLRDAVALSAAAVLQPLAGEVDLDDYRRFRESTRVEEMR